MEEMMNTVKKNPTCSKAHVTQQYTEAHSQENSAVVKSEHPSPEPKNHSSQTLPFHFDRAWEDL